MYKFLLLQVTLNYRKLWVLSGGGLGMMEGLGKNARPFNYDSKTASECFKTTLRRLKLENVSGDTFARPPYKI